MSRTVPLEELSEAQARLVRALLAQQPGPTSDGHSTSVADEDRGVGPAAQHAPARARPSRRAVSPPPC